MNSEKYLFQISSDTAQLREDLKKSKTEIAALNKKVDDSGISLGTMKTKLGGVGTALTVVASAVVATTTALVSYANVQARAQRETEILARIAGVTTEEFDRLSFAFGTVGVSGEQLGDIFKDTQEKVGDFIATGGGGFQDFIDVMGLTKDEAQELAREFENMSSEQVLKAMVKQMEDAGVSSKQMSFALEGMASEATRLIPLLLNNGKAAEELQNRFDEVTIPLSEEEKAQFKELGENFDLAQEAVINFLNNAITPLLPTINKVTNAFAEFFGAFNNKIELGRIIDDSSVASQVDSLKILLKFEEELTASVNEKIDLEGRARGHRKANLNEQINQENEALEAIKAQIQALKDKQIVEEELEAKNGNRSSKTSSGNKSGADEIQESESFLSDIQALEDAQKSRLTLLEEEKQARFEILKKMYDEEAGLTEEQERRKGEIKELIENEFLERAREIAVTEEERKIEAATLEQEQLKELLNNKLISQEEYQASLKEIISSYFPELADPEALEEKNQEELQQLNDKLESQLVSYGDFYSKLSDLQAKDVAEKKKNQKIIDGNSDSSTKLWLDNSSSLVSASAQAGKQIFENEQGVAHGAALVNIALGITKALSTQNYPAAAATALSGAAQLASILSATPDGGGSIATDAGSPETASPQEEFNDQTATVTDITEEEQSTSVMQLVFQDEVIDVIAKQVKKAESAGRV